ncbi:hypothetical protein HGG75_27930 [Ochrobactrum pseudogrignonense]|nr:hypothetical protein [Brucella pseudogrignonensis]
MLKQVKGAKGRVGIEVGFLPIDAFRVLEEELPEVELVDATYTLEYLRALKSSAELRILKKRPKRLSTLCSP